MSGELADEHPHSENEAISRASLISLIERLDKIEKQVDWMLENIKYSGKPLRDWIVKPQ